MNRLFSQMLNSVTCGDCIDVMAHLPGSCVDFVLTDPPYLVRYRDRSGRRVANDDNDAWLKPAFAQIHRVLKPDTLCVSFYGWNKIDLFMAPGRIPARRPDHLPQILRLQLPLSFLPARRRLPPGKGLPALPRPPAAGCHRLALFGQPPAPDAKTGAIPQAA